MSNEQIKNEVFLDLLTHLLGKVRFNFTNEDELQNGIRDLLERNNYRYEREVVLSGTDRIDFMVSGFERTDFNAGVGIEVKVDGSRADVIRQLHRYAQQERVKALILVTSRVKHNDMPETINDKPLKVISLQWRTAF